MTQRFRNAFDALTSAYLKGNLMAGLCNACAVGNIAAYNGCLTEEGINWEKDLYQIRRGRKCLSLALNSLAKGTGYSVREIDHIECTFEGTVREEEKKGLDRENAQYQGLVKVIELLAELDGLDIEAQVETFKKEVT